MKSDFLYSVILQSYIENTSNQLKSVGFCHGKNLPLKKTPNRNGWVLD